MSCIDCQSAPAAPGSMRCEPCNEVALLLQARAILAGSDRIVTKEHLRALDRVIEAQAAAILELQRVVTGPRELSTAEVSHALSESFQRRVAG